MIDYPNKNILYQKAINNWGKELQYGMLSEEVGELLSAINKYRRGRVDKKAVIEEIADVRIMLEQISFMLDITDPSLHHTIQKKLDKMSKMTDELMEETK